MSAIDSYGEFEVPEEKSVIEVVEDPVRTVMSCYELFGKAVQSFINDFTVDYLNNCEKGYKIAEELFSDKEKLTFKPEQITEILDFLSENNKPTRYLRGLFLSALQNKTGLNNLVINRNIWLNQLGYRLQKDKLLIIAKDSNIVVSHLGMYCEGKIINYRLTDYFSYGARAGLQINYGRVRYMADESKGGIQINKNSSAIYDDYFVGRVNSPKKLIKFKGCGISLDKKLNSHTADALFRKYLLPVTQKLDDKLKELDFIPQMENDYEGLVKKVDEFEWKKFENDVKNIADEMIRVLY